MGTNVTPLLAERCRAQDRRRDLPPPDEGAGRGVDPGPQGQPGAAPAGAADLQARDEARPCLGRLHRRRDRRAGRCLHAGREAARSHRTIVLPSEIQLDTKPPMISRPATRSTRSSRPTATDAATRSRCPTGSASARTRSSRCAARRWIHAYQKQVGELHWNGKLGKPPKPALRADTCSTIAARDKAGNQSKPFPFAIAQVRYLIARARRASSCARAASSRCASRPTRRRALDAARPLRDARAPERCISGAEVGRRLPPVRHRRHHAAQCTVVVG